MNLSSPVQLDTGSWPRSMSLSPYSSFCSMSPQFNYLSPKQIESSPCRNGLTPFLTGNAGDLPSTQQHAFLLPEPMNEYALTTHASYSEKMRKKNLGRMRSSNSSQSTTNTYWWSPRQTPRNREETMPRSESAATSTVLGSIATNFKAGETHSFEMDGILSENRRQKQHIEKYTGTHANETNCGTPTIMNSPFVAQKSKIGQNLTTMPFFGNRAPSRFSFSPNSHRASMNTSRKLNSKVEAMLSQIDDIPFPIEQRLRSPGIISGVSHEPFSNETLVQNISEKNVSGLAGAHSQHATYTTERMLTSVNANKHLLQTPAKNADAVVATCFTKRQKADTQSIFKKMHFKHMCSYCNKLFPSQSSLNVHVMIHTGTKPFHCQYCEKSFRQRGHLQSHTRKHTGERPFPCTFPGCAKAFKDRSGLTAHSKKHVNVVDSMTQNS